MDPPSGPLNEEPSVPDRAHEPVTEHRVTHVLNNNAVLARSDSGLSVLVGTGIGFGAKVDDVVTADRVQQQYLALEPDRLHYFSMATSISPEVLSTISEAVDIARERLGELHPSVHLTLTDHLAFAVQRRREGQVIHNGLVSETRAYFPEEFSAAEAVLQWVNSRLDADLPVDEAAFITLHLSAARTGASVKGPLGKANALAEVAEYALSLLGAEDAGEGVREELTSHLARVVKRLDAGRPRSFSAVRSIQRDLPREWEWAARVIRRIVGDEGVRGGRLDGENAHLAVFLHGWSQDLPSTSSRSR